MAPILKLSPEENTLLSELGADAASVEILGDPRSGVWDAFRTASEVGPINVGVVASGRRGSRSVVGSDCRLL